MSIDTSIKSYGTSICAYDFIMICAFSLSVIIFTFYFHSHVLPLFDRFAKRRAEACVAHILKLLGKFMLKISLIFESLFWVCITFVKHGLEFINEMLQKKMDDIDEPVKKEIIIIDDY